METWSAHSKEIDLLVSDIVMGRMNGFQVVEKVRSERKNLPAVLMSGTPFEKKHLGAEFLNKPFAHDELLRAIARCSAKLATST